MNMLDRSAVISMTAQLSRASVPDRHGLLLRGAAEREDALLRLWQDAAAARAPPAPPPGGAPADAPGAAGAAGAAGRPAQVARRNRPHIVVRLVRINLRSLLQLAVLGVILYQARARVPRPARCAPAALLGRAPHAGGCGCLCMACLLPGPPRRAAELGQSAEACLVLTQLHDICAQPACVCACCSTAAPPVNRYMLAVAAATHAFADLNPTSARGAALAEHRPVTSSFAHVSSLPLRRAVKAAT
jgi:hypothetical protein